MNSLKAKIIATAVATGVLIGAGIGIAAPVQAANYTDGISWYWIKNPRCGYFSCWQMKVKASRTSCPDGLFITLDELNSSGDIIGNPIDSVSSLRRGQTAILTFTSTYDGRSSGRLSEVNCF